MTENLQKAVEFLNQGGVIAYPTEAVYGLGCDPFNESAVKKLLTLKNRSIEKGLILIAADFSQIKNLIKPLSPQLLARIFDTWPGHTTWVSPAENTTPRWIRGQFDTVALRVTDHPIAHKLCEMFGGPIVSTSANVEGFPPIRDRRTLEMTFKDKIDFIVPGKVGESLKVSEIRDVISGDVLR